MGAILNFLNAHNFHIFLTILIFVSKFMVYRGMTKYRKERSFRERKIFIRKEHFITLLSTLNSFQCHFIHKAIQT